MMTRLTVTLGFIVAFFAGLIVGFSRSGLTESTIAEPAMQPTTREHRGRSDPGSFLAQQLSLTSEQQERMRAIWADVAGNRGRQQWDARRKLREERDAAIVALIRPEDQPAYEAVLENHEQKQAAMEAEWRAAFQGAVDKTKAMLTDEQRAKYEQLLKQWEERDRDRDRDRHRDADHGGGGQPGGVRPTTAPIQS